MESKRGTMRKGCICLLLRTLIAIFIMDLVPASAQDKSSAHDQELVSAGQESYTSIASIPPGAQIFVDGVLGGTTGSIPVMFFLLRHGDTPRVITIKRDGYELYEQKIVPNGSPILITAVLKPAGDVGGPVGVKSDSSVERSKNEDSQAQTSNADYAKAVGYAVKATRDIQDDMVDPTTFTILQIVAISAVPRKSE